jgi:2-aminoadipate transaminase
MNYKFSNRISMLQPSAIREILKATSSTDVIPFAAGNPAPQAFRLKRVKNITEDILKNRPVEALHTALRRAYEPLRQRVRTYVKEKHSIGKDFDSILITSGAQQVMELSARFSAMRAMRLSAKRRPLLARSTASDPTSSGSGESHLRRMV